ncbi:MAG TPA: hypothetical protein PL037_06335, partial [Elusimicrobiales bacterium]|nr:hypothetical protein [Elusimicrobiales bacterium]
MNIEPQDGSGSRRGDMPACLAGFLLSSTLCLAYFLVNGRGLQVTYGDTWILADIAKRIAFNRSLGMDQVFDIVYPPLYPALISAAYAFRDPASVFNAIASLNILAYSSAFVPLFFLLKDYAGLKRGQAFFGALALLLNPWPLGYAAHISSEPLYYPLAAWFTWLLVKGAYLRGRAELAAFILVFASLPLTKALGNVVFPVFAAFCVVMYIFSERPRPRALILRPLLAFSAAALAFFAYKKYQLSVLPPAGDVTGGYLYNLRYPNLLEPAYWLDRTRLDLSWLCRGTKTAAFPLFLALLAAQGKRLVKDPLVVFSLLIYSATFVVVPLFTPGDPLFREHPRYYIPFVFSFAVVVMKYRDLIAGRELLTAAGILAAGIAAGFPPDFMREPVRWQIGVYYLVWFGILYYGRRAFSAVMISLMLSSAVIGIWTGRKLPSEESGYITGFYDPRGITRTILGVRAENPEARVLVDRLWRGHELPVWREYQRVMTGLPLLPSFVDAERPFAGLSGGGGVYLLLTHRRVRGGEKLVQGD